MAKKFLVATDSSGIEALYVDGKFRRAEDTLYATELAEEAGGVPIILTHRSIDLGDADEVDWPKDASDLVDD